MEKEYKYIVCTRCSTYNHAPYINDALKGFAMQEVTFPAVFCIMDDASTDGACDILKKWAEEKLDFEEEDARNEALDYGNLIVAHLKGKKNLLFVIVLLKDNHFQMKKSKLPYIAEWHECAKYIALCEGDDYWINPHKLQKQVDFMEDNPDYGMVSSASKIYTQGVGMNKGIYGHEYRGLVDLLSGNYFYHATLLTKKSLEDRYNQEIGSHEGWKMGDWPRLLHSAIVSKIGYIDDPMSVYRVLPNSASHFDSFDKFKAFNENSVYVAKFFIDKYNLNAEKLNPILDDWLNKRLLMKACFVGDVRMVKEYRSRVERLSNKDRLYVFLSSHYITAILYNIYRKARLYFSRIK